MSVHLRVLSITKYKIIPLIRNTVNIFIKTILQNYRNTGT